MNTRRNFVRGLTGIGAIVATGHAPAIVRSALAARGTMLGGARAWTNPYVTDGLVAMWDGEWNVAGGVHDANANIWADLVGSNSFGNFATDVTFGENYIDLPPKVPAATNVGLSPSAISTIEAVVSLSGWDGLVLAVFSVGGISNVQRWLGFRVNKTFNFGNNFLCAPFPANTNEVFYVAGVFTGTSWELYYNGVQVSNIGPGMNWGSSLNGIPSLMTGGSSVSASKIYSMRLSSRQLTSSEIAANYSVDKERFNLP